MKSTCIFANAERRECLRSENASVLLQVNPVCIRPTFLGPYGNRDYEYTAGGSATSGIVGTSLVPFLPRLDGQNNVVAIINVTQLKSIRVLSESR